jgi:GT2 family glycosyltransferase
MVVSVIIVNYRVKYFLELCLHSVEKAIKDMKAEIIVVDNHSNDDSLDYLRPRFPRVRFLANHENAGFGRANNLALKEARGKYILFLNPDTVLPEDFAVLCLAFIEATPRIGALGVKMIDGSGRFLPESRRGFPSPWVAFCKLSGLAAIFPHSRWFARYYLGHLSADFAHPAPVLSGACVWIASAVLQEVGGFDEQFFLYAEDIDLSYRIERAGYTNCYYPGTTIVHFKGESTTRDTGYVRQFYRAMSQFRRKHFGSGMPVFFNWGIEGAIRLRAGMAAVGRLARQRTGMKTGQVRRIWVDGDIAEAGRVKGRLAGSEETTVVRNEADADEVILCEGERWSFRQCIARLEVLARAGGKRVFLHAAGSDSAVGSPVRGERGETIVF